MNTRKNSLVLFCAAYTMAIALAFLVFSVSLNLYTNMMSRTQANTNVERIRAYAQTADHNLRKLSEVSSQIEYNSFIRNWINTPFVATNLLDVRNILDNNMAIVTSDLRLFSIDIYNVNEAMVLSTFSGYYNIDAPSASAHVRSQQFLRFVTEKPRDVRYQIDKSNGQLGLVTYMKPMDAVNWRGIVAVSADIGKLLGEDIPQDVLLFLTDPEDGWSASVGESTRSVELGYLDFLKDQGNMPANELRSVTVGGKGEMNVMSLQIFSGRLTLHAAFPLLNPATLMIRNTDTFTFVVAAIFFVCLLLAWVIVTLANQPLQRLLAKAEGKRTPGGPVQRLELLMDHYAQQEQALQKSLEMNRSYLRERLLRNLVFGRLTQHSDVWPSEILDLTGNHYLIAFFAFFASTEKSEGKPVFAEIETYARSVGEALGEHARCELIHISPMEVAFLLSFESKPVYLDFVHLVEREIQAAACASIRAVVGLSNVGQSPEELPELYDQAVVASRSGNPDNGSCAITHPMFLQNSHQYAFIQVVKPLIGALRKGSVEEISASLAELFERYAAMRPEERDSFLVFLISAINRVSQSFGASLQELMPEDLFDVFLNKRTPEEQIGFLQAVCERIVNLRADSDKQYKRASVELAIQYLKVHFDKPIQLNTLADELKISPSYLSELLKKELKMTYLKYIQTLRMERAKELLLRTPLTIKEIALMVGYDSEHSFIRIFKSFEQLTPSQYRARHGSADS